MKKKLIKPDKREFSTETLIDVEYAPEDVQNFDSGRAVGIRNTQFAEELDDLAEFQKHAYGHEEKRRTHNYGVLQAVRDYNPDVSEESLEEIEDEFEPRPLVPDDVDYENIMEQFTNTPTKPNYWFEEFGDYWSCSCGHLNKGDHCKNCGLERELLRSLFILHKPGENPGEYEGMPVVYEEVKVPKGRLTSSQKLVVAIVALLILMVVGGLFSYFKMIKPAMEAEAAKNLQTTTDYMVNDISACVQIRDGFLWDSYIAAGDARMKDKDFTGALEFYNLAKAINSTSALKEKILNAKYGYVTANQSKGGEKFEKYLSELVGAGYSDAKKIYSDYYKWSTKVVANLAVEDYSGDISIASRTDTVYFHVSLSGGPPGEAIDVYYEATWPNGSKQTEQIGTGWKDGSRGYARFSYPVPINGAEGKLTFKVINKSTQEVLGTDSITFQK